MKLSPIYKTILGELNIGHEERLHTSATPVTEIEITTQERMIQGKPNGFWYSFGNQWMLFARDELDDDRFSNENYVYKVYPNLNKMIVIDSFDTAYDFTRTYTDLSKMGKDLNWEAIAKDYSGIELRNYSNLRNSWRRYHNMIWIYSWDVDSGCIWHPSGLIRLKLLGRQSSVKNLPAKIHYPWDD